MNTTPRNVRELEILASIINLVANGTYGVAADARPALGDRRPPPTRERRTFSDAFPAVTAAALAEGYDEEGGSSSEEPGSEINNDGEDSGDPQEGPAPETPPAPPPTLLPPPPPPLTLGQVLPAEALEKPCHVFTVAEAAGHLDGFHLDASWHIIYEKPGEERKKLGMIRPVDGLKLRCTCLRHKFADKPPKKCV